MTLLAGLDGGDILALSLMLKHGYGEMDGLHTYRLLHDAKEHDDVALPMCQAIASRFDGIEDFVKACCSVQGFRMEFKAFEKFRQKHLQHRPRRELRSNPYFFQSMIALAETHTKQKSRVLVIKVADGYDKLEELIELICEYCVEGQMDGLKKEWEDDLREFGIRPKVKMEPTSPHLNNTQTT